MKAIILAAGRGSRMGGATAERPKCLVELSGRPLLDWQIHALRQGGIEDIAIVRGFQKRLKNVAGFQYVPDPLPMKNKKRAVVYYLFFASAKPVAENIIKDIFAKHRAT